MLSKEISLRNIEEGTNATVQPTTSLDVISSFDFIRKHGMCIELTSLGLNHSFINHFREVHRYIISLCTDT
uniref:Uncharacterized protein n=1 Tax=Parascaris univalens TaxID=6257 RepID=A0A915A984_PARUN